MTNPLGYYVSVQQDHPAHPILAALSSGFGSHFEALTKETLLFILAFCAAENARELWQLTQLRPLNSVEKSAFELIDQLPDDFKFGLIPFLHEQISDYDSRLGASPYIGPDSLADVTATRRQQWQDTLLSLGVPHQQAIAAAQVLTYDELGVPRTPAQQELMHNLAEVLTQLNH